MMQKTECFQNILFLTKKKKNPFSWGIKIKMIQYSFFTHNMKRCSILNAKKVDFVSFSCKKKKT